MKSSEDRYFDEFKEVIEFLYQSLEKNPDNKKIENLIKLQNNMFVFTLDLLNKAQSIHLENGFLYEEIRKLKVELLNNNYKKEKNGKD